MRMHVAAPLVSLSAAWLALAGAPGAFAAEADAPVVVAPPGVATGDADASLAALVGVVERDPGSVEALAALIGTQDYWSSSLDAAPHTARLEKVLSAGTGWGETDEALRKTLAERYRVLGDFAKRRALQPDRGYLGSFLVTGPFGVSYASAVDEPYAPEQSIELDREMAGSRGPVRWLPLKVRDLGDMVEPFDVLRPTSGVAYALSQIRVPAATDAVLKVAGWGSLRVWVNGVEVGALRRLDRTLPRTGWFPAKLEAGWNRILVKNVGEQGFLVKVCDAQRGLPLEGVEEETGRVLHPAAEAAAPGTPVKVSYRTPLDAVAERDAKSGAALALKGMVLDNYGLQWEAYDAFDAAVAASPKDAGVLWRAASFIESFRDLPEPRWRTNRARALYESAVEASPGHIGAASSLAGFLHREDRTEEAIAGLRELPAAQEGAEVTESRTAMERSRSLFPGLAALLEARPDWSDGWMLRADMCSERKWTTEAEAAAARALEANPRSLRAIHFMRQVAESVGDTKGTEAALRRVLEIDRGHAWARRSLAEILHRTGDSEAALRMFAGVIEDFPSDDRSRLRRAEILASLRRYDEAIAIARELAALSPLEEQYPRLIGDWSRLKGDDAGARTAWVRSLELDPSRAVLRRTLDRMDGREEDFARPYEEDAVALWRACGGQDVYPKAIAVHLLDLQVQRANEDGSYSSITHNAWKILNEQGREKYSRISVPGQLLEVRAVSPEGEEFLPIGALGRQFTMEGLQAGWLLEYRYLNDSGADERGFNSGRWYFQDPGFESGSNPDPVLVSRLVLDAPASLNVNLQMRNLPVTPQITNTPAGRRVTVWEMRNMDRIEPEPNMPDADELCPSVSYYTAWTWPELVHNYRDYLRNLRPTPLLTRQAAEICGALTDPMEKTRALYAWVNENITGNSGSGGATGILMERSGDRFLAFAALCVAAEIPLDLVRICTDPDDASMFEVLEPDAFDAWALSVGGGESPVLVCYPFARHTPLGLVPQGLRGKPAFLASARGAHLFRIPAGNDDEVRNVNDIKVVLGATPADTTFNATLFRPADGWYGSKESVKDMNEDNRQKNAANLVSSLLPAADLRTWEWPGLETAGKPYVLVATGVAPRLLREEGGAFVLSLVNNPMDMAGRYVDKSEREWDLVLRGDVMLRDVMEYDLAGRWSVASLPPPHHAASLLGTYSLVPEMSGGRILIRREIRFRPCRYTPDAYRAFITWCRAIDTAEGQKIVLRPVK